MKKSLIIALSALALLSCSTDKIVDTVSVDGGRIQGVLTDNPEVMMPEPSIPPNSGICSTLSDVAGVRWKSTILS